MDVSCCLPTMRTRYPGAMQITITQMDTPDRTLLLTIPDNDAPYSQNLFTFQACLQRMMVFCRVDPERIL